MIASFYPVNGDRRTFPLSLGLCPPADRVCDVLLFAFLCELCFMYYLSVFPCGNCVACVLFLCFFVGIVLHVFSFCVSLCELCCMCSLSVFPCVNCVACVLFLCFLV